MQNFLLVRSKRDNLQEINHIVSVNYTSRARADQDCEAYNELNERSDSIYSVKELKLDSSDPDGLIISASIG